MTVPAARTRQINPTRVLDVVLDASVALLGVWTVLFHGGAALGMRIPGVTIAWIVLVGPVVWLVARHTSDPDRPPPASDALRRPLAIASVVVGAVAVVLLAAERDVLFWFAAVGALALGWFARGRGPATRPDDPPASDNGTWWIVATALLFATISLTTTEWVADNSYYIDHAMAIADDDGPIPMGVDTMFGDREFIGVSGENDLSTLEGLYGGLSWLSGVHPMSLLSFGFTPWLHVLMVLAIWRVARVLGLPDPHLATIVAITAFFLMSGSSLLGTVAFSSRSGRSFLIGVFVPVVLAYAIDLVSRPTSPRAWLLALALVGGVGVTLTSFIVLPVVALVGLAVGFDKDAWATSALRAALLPAAVVIAHWSFVYVWSSRLVVPDPGESRPIMPAGQYWQGVIGHGLVYLLVTGIVLGAWLVAPTRRARRLVLLAPLGALLLISPPVVTVLANTAAASSLRRVLWALPLPVIFAVVAAGLLRLRSFGLAAGAVAAWLFAMPLLSAAGPNLEVGVPSWDVLPEHTAAARRMTDLARPGSRVVSPWNVAWFVPIVSAEVYPLAVRPPATRHLGQIDPDFRGDDRRQLVGFVAGGRSVPPERVEALLLELEVTAACLAPGAQDEVGRAPFEHSGFQPAGSDELCEYWYLPS